MRGAYTGTVAVTPIATTGLPPVAALAPAPVAVGGISGILMLLQVPGSNGAPRPLTENERTSLASWRYPTGSPGEGQPAFTPTQPDLLFEVVSLVSATTSLQSILDRLSEIARRPPVYPTVSKTTEGAVDVTNLIFELNSYEKEKTNYQADLDRSRRAISSIKGQEACPKCHSLNTESNDIQTRSADEPMTHIIQCFACGKVTRD